MENINIFHDSHNILYRNPFGAVTCGTKVYIGIFVENCDEVNIELIHFDYSKEIIKANFIENIFEFESKVNGENNISINCQEIETYIHKGLWVGEITVEDAGIINYYFSIKQGDKTIYYGNNEESLGGVGKIYYDNPKFYQITVYEEFKVPQWYKEGIMYQIFVESFCNGNLVSKEDYSNNISNIEYNHVKRVPLDTKKNSFIYGNWYDDPLYIKDEKGNILRWAFYGGNLKGVIEKLSYLKSLGVTIIYLNPIFQASSPHKYDTGDYLKIDSMYGDDSIFKQLCEEAKEIGIRIILDGVFSHTGEDSVYFNKYGNYDSVGAYQSKNSSYYSWYRFKNHPEDYDSWWGVKALPNVNELEPSYMNFIIKGKDSVISKWLSLGASGWRLDVADELPDEFITELKKKLKEVNEEGVLIGEVWEDASNKISYDERRKYLFGKELDSIMNYPFRNLTLDFFRGDINSNYFMRKILSLYENYPKDVFYSCMNIIGTHDTERIMTMYLEYGHNKEVGHKLVKLSSLLQMTFPGVPSIYYGDEAGLQGGKDPYNRKAYPWHRENAEILQWYKIITSIRKDYDVFKKGDLKFYESSPDIICFERNYSREKAIIIINRSIDKCYEYEIKLQLYNMSEELCFRNLLENHIEKVDPKEKIFKTKIHPLEGKIFIKL